MTLSFQAAAGAVKRRGIFAPLDRDPPGWTPSLGSTVGTYRTGCNSRSPIPAATSRPTCPCTDSGCNATVRFDPPTRTLAPRPEATETSAVAPRYLPASIPAYRFDSANTDQTMTPPPVTPMSSPIVVIVPV